MLVECKFTTFFTIILYVFRFLYTLCEMLMLGNLINTASMFNVSLTHLTLMLNISSVRNTDFIIASLLLLLFIIGVMSKHTIIIICCSMSAIWLASTSTYHLHPDSLESFSVAVAEVVSSKANNAQNLMSDSLFGHRDSESTGMELDT